MATKKNELRDNLKSAKLKYTRVPSSKANGDSRKRTTGIAAKLDANTGFSGAIKRK
jgi:hypothetical protein